MPEELTTQRWVYGGRRPIAGSKSLGALWWVPEDSDDPERFFKLERHLQIGAAYEVQANESGRRANTKNVKWLESDAVPEDLIREWTLADRAAYANDQLRKREAKAKAEGDRFGSMTLDEIQAYIDTHPSQATAMAGAVIRHIFARPRR